MVVLSRVGNDGWFRLRVCETWDEMNLGSVNSLWIT